MGSPINFDATAVEPSPNPDPLPAGWYRMHITDSTVKRSASGKGHYLKLEFTALDAPYAGRKVWNNLNIQHDNKKAQEIAQRQLSALCHAVGVLRLSSSAQLHTIPLLVKLTIKQDEGFDPANEVKGFKGCEGGPGVALPKHGSTLHGNAVAGAVAGTIPPAAAPAPAPTSTASSLPAWMQDAHRVS